MKKLLFLLLVAPLFAAAQAPQDPLSFDYVFADMVKSIDTMSNVKLAGKKLYQARLDTAFRFVVNRRSFDSTLFRRFVIIPNQLEIVRESAPIGNGFATTDNLGNAVYRKDVAILVTVVDNRKQPKAVENYTNYRQKQKAARAATLRALAKELEKPD